MSKEVYKQRRTHKEGKKYGSKLYSAKKQQINQGALPPRSPYGAIGFQREVTLFLETSKFRIVVSPDLDSSPFWTNTALLIKDSDTAILN